jgi:hypothetical protein
MVLMKSYSPRSGADAHITPAKRSERRKVSSLTSTDSREAALQGLPFAYNQHAEDEYV